MGIYLDIAKQVEADLSGGPREESAVVVHEPLPPAPRAQTVCPHQAHFPPTPTDGPTRQCAACPHCWSVACACGAAAWTPTAHWGVDGAGVVVWTCTGCGVPYSPDTAGRQQRL